MSRRESVSAERFVVAYLHAHKNGWTIGQLADYLGMEKASANVKASQLRGEGLNLPKLKQVRAKKDLSALARMVSDYEASLFDLDGNRNMTISDHLGTDVPFDDTEFVAPPEEGNDGRTLIGSM